VTVILIYIKSAGMNGLKRELGSASYVEANPNPNPNPNHNKNKEVSGLIYLFGTTIDIFLY
jgi:hypothetical protein